MIGKLLCKYGFHKNKTLKEYETVLGKVKNFKCSRCGEEGAVLYKKRNINTRDYLKLIKTAMSIELKCDFCGQLIHQPQKYLGKNHPVKVVIYLVMPDGKIKCDKCRIKELLAKAKYNQAGKLPKKRIQALGIAV